MYLNIFYLIEMINIDGIEIFKNKLQSLYNKKGNIINKSEFMN